MCCTNPFPYVLVPTSATALPLSCNDDAKTSAELAVPSLINNTISFCAASCCSSFSANEYDGDRLFDANDNFMPRLTCCSCKLAKELIGNHSSVLVDLNQVGCSRWTCSRVVSCDSRLSQYPGYR